MKEKPFKFEDLVVVKRAPAKAYPFKVGDHARLRSGGPKLTVTGVNNDRVTVSWTTPSGESSDTFPSICLDPLDS